MLLRIVLLLGTMNVLLACFLAIWLQAITFNDGIVRADVNGLGEGAIEILLFGALLVTSTITTAEAMILWRERHGPPFGRQQR